MDRFGLVLVFVFVTAFSCQQPLEGFLSPVSLLLLCVLVVLDLREPGDELSENANRSFFLVC